CRIDDIGSIWACGMSAAGTVAPFTTDVPLLYGFRLDVVIHGVAPITQRPRRPLHIVGWIVWDPPIGVRLHEIGSPLSVSDIPLCLQRKVIIADLLEVSLFPLCSIHQRDIIQFESK